jgi:hypothetical protein
MRARNAARTGDYQRDPEQVAEEFDRWLERKRDRGKMTSVAADRLRQVAPAQHHHGIEFLPGRFGGFYQSKDPDDISW